MTTKLGLIRTKSAAYLQHKQHIVRVISCTRSNLVVKVTGAADDGLIFIKGQGENCKQTTSSGEEFYEFDFASCNIEWEMTFRIIVQKLRSFQTGSDKQIPVMCIADTNEVVVSSFLGAADKDDDAGLNRTTKPIASLSFFKVITGEEVIGSEVKLTDRLIMSLQMEQEFINDFDMKARYCQTSDIVIIEDFCSVEPELFGNFWKVKQGNLMNEFSAFRTTALDGGSVMMNFTCILQLCQGPCVPEKCDDSYTGWGRKRRDANREITGDERFRRQTGNDDTIDVGGSINVVENYSTIKILTNEEFCCDKLALCLLIICLCSGIVAPSIGCFTLYRKLVRCQDMLQEATYFSKPTSQKLSAAAILH
ncbi:uncharacterized protein LOC110455610 isoform X2 [Mizuhopecten yessoensis]|uniref:uncharacterized protein LOC110455610 isoform X2 n=1 Tax=Mizuhopecten yessoensis TaxID=6573 RepID=UPI000B45F434|nr:uncharacterized protein LOC110455610 isoform X2 [Mizuhopecten yessoensis]